MYVSVNRVFSFLESENVSLGVDLLVKLDDGTTRAAEYRAAVLHHRALAVIEGKNISQGLKICLVDSVFPSPSPETGYHILYKGIDEFFEHDL